MTAVPAGEPSMSDERFTAQLLVPWRPLPRYLLMVQASVGFDEPV